MTKAHEHLKALAEMMAEKEIETLGFRDGAIFRVQGNKITLTSLKGEMLFETELNQPGENK